VQAESVIQSLRNFGVIDRLRCCFGHSTFVDSTDRGHQSHSRKLTSRTLLSRVQSYVYFSFNRLVAWFNNWPGVTSINLMKAF
jgi:hypothetical protein